MSSSRSSRRSRSSSKSSSRGSFRADSAKWQREVQTDRPMSVVIEMPLGGQQVIQMSKFDPLVKRLKEEIPKLKTTDFQVLVKSAEVNKASQLADFYGSQERQARVVIKARPFTQKAMMRLRNLTSRRRSRR